MGKRILKRVLGLGILLILLVSAAFGQWGLTVTKYTLTSEKLTGSFRVVQLSDLHNREFGADNARLLAKVAEQKPDLIFVTGDFVTRFYDERETALSLLKSLRDIAPVYLSMGNHDAQYGWRYGVDLYELYAQTGVTVLEREYADIEVNGQKIRVGGILGYCQPEQSENASPTECAYLREFGDTNRYTLLLCHYPVAWIESGALDAWQVECVFSGHAHGGQIRLPLIGGIIAPDQGLFPGRVAGQYTSTDGERTMLLSRGLGSSVPVPRVFNTPEIVVVDFVPAG